MRRFILLMSAAALCVLPASRAQAQPESDQPPDHASGASTEASPARSDADAPMPLTLIYKLLEEHQRPLAEVTEVPASELPSLITRFEASGGVPVFCPGDGVTPRQPAPGSRQADNPWGYPDSTACGVNRDERLLTLAGQQFVLFDHSTSPVSGSVSLWSIEGTGAPQMIVVAAGELSKVEVLDGRVTLHLVDGLAASRVDLDLGPGHHASVSTVWHDGLENPLETADFSMSPRPEPLEIGRAAAPLSGVPGGETYEHASPGTRGWTMGRRGDFTLAALPCRQELREMTDRRGACHTLRWLQTTFLKTP